MGLLDQFGEFVRTPEGQGLISAVAGGMAGARRGTPWNNFGRAGLAGLSGYAGAIDSQTKAEETALQKQQRTMQMDELKRKQAEAAAQQQWRAGLTGVMKPSDSGEVNQGAVNDYMMRPESPFLDDLLKQQLFPGDKKYLTVGGAVIDPATMQPVYTTPDKPEKINPNQPFMLVDGKPVPNEAYQRYELEKAARGASRVSQNVNTGQKGFDNTLKLRGDFRSEPIYKAHQDVQSAHAQISSALKQASPAGDLAGATKLMKILDPGSVVRESELGMAMAASGALDRLQNYASNVMSGNKLTPTQRKDFQALADSLYSESVKQYNGKRAEYQGIAERNQLSVPDVLGPELKASQATKPVGQVSPFADPAKEQAYQQWKAQQGAR
jgi:hypothetical protein